jgi:hypothetical protein
MTTLVKICGNAEAGAITAMPAVKAFSDARRPPSASPRLPPPPVVPLGIMNTRCSIAGVRPLCARLASPVKVLALSMACRRLPWPLSLVLTTVSKLKPKSTPATLDVVRVTGATACAVPLSPAL